MGPRQIGVEIDHLRLEPQPKLHAELVHKVGERLETIRPNGGIHQPVAKALGVVAACHEPAIVKHKAFHSNLRSERG
jgi:hypothetical protein